MATLESPKKRNGGRLIIDTTNLTMKYEYKISAFGQTGSSRCFITLLLILKIFLFKKPQTGIYHIRIIKDSPVF